MLSERFLRLELLVVFVGHLAFADTHTDPVHELITVQMDIDESI